MPAGAGRRPPKATGAGRGGPKATEGPPEAAESRFWVQPALLVVVSRNSCGQTPPIAPTAPKSALAWPAFPRWAARTTLPAPIHRFASKSAKICRPGHAPEGPGGPLAPEGPLRRLAPPREMENPAKTTQRGRGNRRKGRLPAVVSSRYSHAG